MARSRRRDQRRTRRGWLAVLLAVAVIGSVLPKALTDRLISLVQVIVPFQDWSTRTADAVTQAGGGPAAPSPDEALALQRENAGLRHRLAALSAAHHQLAVDFADVSRIRRQGLRGGQLIPARVLAADAATWRESRLVSAGALRGVRPQAPVTSDLFTVAAEQGADALRDGQSVLAGEALVGFVEQVGTHTARIRLLTDRQAPLKVRIARPQEDSFLPLDAEFWLVGAGGAHLEVRDVNHRFIRAGSIREGDVVLNDPDNPALPAALMVGRISAIRVDPENPLLYRLTVEPPVKPGELRSVFVVAFEAPPPQP
jgi:hypothetical protein